MGTSSTPFRPCRNIPCRNSRSEIASPKWLYCALPFSSAFAQMPPESVDLLIEARWVLPIAPVNTVLADHAVAVTSGRIVALGPTAQMNARFEPRERVVRHDHALLPGFVNAHTRAAMTLFRGLPVRGPRSRWLLETVHAAEERCMSPDFI